MRALKKFIPVLAALTFMITGAVTCYAYSYGDLKTVTIKSTDGWKNQFDGPYDTKESDSEKFKVYSTAQTMSSNPSVRLINSDGEIRSSSVTVSKTYHEYTGDNNTGSSGYNYWTQTKPGWNQVGSDTMKYQINTY